MNLVSVKQIILLVDLSGSTKAFQSQNDEKMAEFLQQYYVTCDKVAEEMGGTIIKFMGDACLATFPPDQAKNAVEAVIQLQAGVRGLVDQYRISVGMGANLHLSSVIDAEFGAGTSRRRDIIGRGVNQTFLLGRGPGIRISEPVYRALPSAARSRWNKHKPPAVYHLDAPGGIYAGMGKSPGANTLRW